MILLAWLISLAIQAAKYLIIGSVVLTLIGQVLRPRWINHPVVQFVIGLGYALYAPIRQLMRLLGIPVRPIDFSPLVTILLLDFLNWLIFLIFR